jgi:hypothetical protein
MIGAVISNIFFRDSSSAFFAALFAAILFTADLIVAALFNATLLLPDIYYIPTFKSIQTKKKKEKEKERKGKETCI